MSSYEVVEKQPQDTRYFPTSDDPAANMTPGDVHEITEIFKTPLISTYNWDYSLPDSKIRKLYNLGKRLNWDVEVELDWNETFPKDQFPLKEERNPYSGFGPYEALSEEEKINFSWHRMALQASGMLHGEQGALLVASQLTNCAPSYEAKLYAASQTFDEARHVEFFNKFIQTQVGIMYPCGPGLKALMDKILTDARWDLKFIGMQIIIEGLALAAFNTAMRTSNIPVHQQGLYYVLRDEARHVKFGMQYLEEYLQRLSPDELEERAQFAFEASTSMGASRANGTRMFERYGWDREEVRKHLRGNSPDAANFREQLFGRIMPNLKSLGLLTNKTKPQWEALGLLEFQDLSSDSQINWSEMERPLPSYEEIYEESLAA